MGFSRRQVNSLIFDSTGSVAGTGAGPGFVARAGTGSVAGTGREFSQKTEVLLKRN